MDTKNHKTRRLDAYIRVSQVAGREGDSFISPKVQEERIRGWAAGQGHEIIAVHPEIDVSGGTMDRPLLNEVMRRIEKGETEGVVVFNLSRFARTLIGSIELIERINDRGALFASVSDGFDITTITGRLVMNILLAIAQSERERAQEGWRISRADAVKRGIHIATPMFGYLRGRGPINPRTGRPTPAPLEVDPVTGPIVKEIFERRAAGESLTKIRDSLNASNVPTVNGARWAAPTLDRIIKNRTYLGIASGAVREFKGGPLPEGVKGAHPALVDEALWQAAQGQVGARRDLKPSPLVTRGFVRCAACRYTAQVIAPRGTLSYQCGRVRSIGDCPDPVIVTALPKNGEIGIEQFVIEEMWRHLELRQRQIKFKQLDPSLDVSGHEQRIAELTSKRERDSGDERLRQSYGDDNAFYAYIASLSAEIKAEAAQRDEKQRLAGIQDERPVAELKAEWESGRMSMEAKRELMGRVIRMVFVKRAPAGVKLPKVDSELRRQHLAGRTHIVWRTDPIEIDVPRQGVRVRNPIRPFVFPDTHPHGTGVADREVLVEGAGEALA
jgi:site-specific DNA recombinase